MAPTPTTVMILKRVTKEELGDSAPRLLHLWIYFNLIGNTILLPIVVLTFLISKNARRHPTLVNLCITWIFSGIFSLLLFHPQKHVRHDQSPSAVCIAQASLLYGITPMWSVAILAMVNYMVQTLRGWDEKIPMGITLSAPYIAQFGFTLAALLLAIQEPDRVTRHRRYFYCWLSKFPLFVTMSIFTLVMAVVIVVLEFILALTIHRNWRGMREIGLPSGVVFPLVIRVLLFGFFVILGIAVIIISLIHESLVIDIYMATAGTAVFLIFGTQADVLRTWCFCWRKRHRSPSPAEDLTPQNDTCRFEDQRQDFPNSTKADDGLSQSNSPVPPPTSKQIVVLLELAEPGEGRDTTTEHTQEPAENTEDMNVHRKNPLQDPKEVDPKAKNEECQRSDKRKRSRCLFERLSSSSRSTEGGVESVNTRNVKGSRLRWKRRAVKPKGPRMLNRKAFGTANAD